MNRHTADEITFSFICPVYNQADALEPFHENLKAAADALGETYEVIFVNDGSDDESLEIIRSLTKRDGALRYIDLSRSFGRDIALMAGYDCAAGRAMITMACDGRHRPEPVGLLIEKWQTGSEVVQAAPDTAGGPETRRCCFRLLDRKVVGAIRNVQGRPGSIEELIDWVGFRQASVRYPTDPDAPGEPKVPWGRRILDRLGALTSLSLLSIRAVAVAGAAMMAAAILYGLIAGALAMYGMATFSPMLLGGLALVGIQLLALATVGYYVGGIYQQTSSRPLYVIRHSHGFAEEEPTAPEPPDRQGTEAARFTVMT